MKSHRLSAKLFHTLKGMIANCYLSKVRKTAYLLVKSSFHKLLWLLISIVQYLVRCMKQNKFLIDIFVVLCVIFITGSVVGCSEKNGRFDVSGQTTGNIIEENLINSLEDIENLVTDDEKLVINYYDAYIWTVFFDESGVIDKMIYIYEFGDEKEAESMVDVRQEQLSQNKTMSITDAISIENFVVITLTDTSFTNVTRGMLENNFNGLIVY